MAMENFRELYEILEQSLAGLCGDLGDLSEKLQRCQPNYLNLLRYKVETTFSVTI
jgi:hypothetical protein